MIRSVVRRMAFTVAAMLIASPAMAGYSIEVLVDAIPVGLIADNGPDDLNAAVGDIWYHFQLMDAQNRWLAEGDVFAEGGYDGVPPVSTIVTNTLIEKIANVPLLDGQIDFIHNYAASGLLSHVANIDGVLDNTIDHEVKGVSLDYSADINGQSLGSFGTGFYAGPGPLPFDDVLGPLVLPTTTEHHMRLRFYLDSLGDSIELFNSAEIHSGVPEPSLGGFVLIAIGAACGLRHRQLH
jgi:hypothetical protein